MSSMNLCSSSDRRSEPPSVNFFWRADGSKYRTAIPTITIVTTTPNPTAIPMIIGPRLPDCCSTPPPEGTDGGGAPGVLPGGGAMIGDSIVGLSMTWASGSPSCTSSELMFSAVSFPATDAAASAFSAVTATPTLILPAKRDRRLLTASIPVISTLDGTTPAAAAIPCKKLV